MSLHPIRDASGEYCYTIGLLADAKSTNDEQKGIIREVLRMLPKVFEVSCKGRGVGGREE